MKLEFNDPMLISQGPSSDMIVMMLKRPELFAPEGSDELLDEGSLKLEVVVPKQLPPGVSAEKVEKSAGGAKNSVLAIMVVRVLTQIFLKGSIDHIIGLFLALQILCYMMYYNISLPSITEMVLQEFKKIIEFEFLNPEGMVRLWKPDFKLNEWMTGVKADIINPEKSNSMMDSLIVYIGVGAAGVVTLVSLFITSYICRKRVKKQFDKIKKKLFFNGIVRSITISYVTVCLTVGKQLRLYVEGSEF